MCFVLTFRVDMNWGTWVIAVYALGRLLVEWL